MATTNGLSTPLSLSQYMKLVGTVPSYTSTTKEEVGTGSASATTYWLDNLGVLENTYSFTYGSTEGSASAVLTETTHYTVDLDLSKVTLTASGVSALSTFKLFAAYKYNTERLLNSDLLDALNAAENKVLRTTDQTFTNTTLLGYRKVLNEPIKAHYDPVDKVFDLKWSPLVKIETTCASAYTTGGTTVTLSDASLLPSSGTIYIDTRKVAYSVKTGNDLTIPSTTPDLNSGGTVRAECIELSSQPEGATASYTVLQPEVDYEIDYDQGRIKVLRNALWSEISNTDRIYPSNYLVRASYMSAWHEFGEDATIPDEIEWVVNAIAARKLMGQIVAKSHVTGLNEFDPSLIDGDKEAIQEVLDEYSTLNISTSMYNKQSLS